MIRATAIRRDITGATTRLFNVTLAATAVTLLVLGAQPASAQATASTVTAMPTTANMFDVTTFKKPSDAALKKSLTPLQYSVTQRTRVGQASPGRWRRRIFARRSIVRCTPSAQKSAPNMQTHIWAISSTMDRSQPGYATASTRRRCVSFQQVSWRKRVMASMRSCSRGASKL